MKDGKGSSFLRALWTTPYHALLIVIIMPRRKPFSNKQKKIQLQEKRLRKKEKGVVLAR